MSIHNSRPGIAPAALTDYLLGKPDACEDYPFGPEAAVYKVHNKMFALVFERNRLIHINLKCDPFEAQQLRDIFAAITPGYHMNKRHWNTVVLDGSLPNGEIERMIDHSYGLVVRGLPKAARQSLELRFEKAVLYGSSMR